jgi:hypothetical protein
MHQFSLPQNAKLNQYTGSLAQAWQAAPAPVGYVFHPANNVGLCLDIQGYGTTAETLVQAWACNCGNNKGWVLN